MIYILLDHDQVTAEQLSEQLAVSVRTIYRYIDTLSTAGIPIYTAHGRNGGISLLPEFKISKALVNQDEQIDILTSLKNMRDLDVQDDQTLAKLSAVFQQAPVDWLKIDPTAWRKDDAQEVILAQLRSAILNHQFVSFQYLNAKNETSNREVYPFQVMFKNNAWYLTGYSLERKASRSFKLTRLSGLKLEQTDHPEVAGQPWLAHSTMQSAPMPQIQVRLRLAERLKYRVFEEFPKSDISQIKSAEYEVVTMLNEGDWLVTYLLSFGSGLTVLAPQSLRDQLRSEVQKILANY